MRNKEHFCRPVPEKETTEKKGDKARNPSPEPEGTKKWWWNRMPKEQGDKPRNSTRNQMEQNATRVGRQTR